MIVPFKVLKYFSCGKYFSWCFFANLHSCNSKLDKKRYFSQENVGVVGIFLMWKLSLTMIGLMRP